MKIHLNHLGIVKIDGPCRTVSLSNCRHLGLVYNLITRNQRTKNCNKAKLQLVANQTITSQYFESIDKEDEHSRDNLLDSQYQVKCQSTK